MTDRVLDELGYYLLAGAGGEGPATLMDEARRGEELGLGTAFIRAIMDEWAKRGRGTRVRVLVTNEASRKLCRKLGMHEVETDDQAYIELRWYPPK